MAGVRIRPRRLVLVGSVVVDVLLFVDRLPDRGGDLLARQAVAAAGGGFNVLAAASSRPESRCSCRPYPKTTPAPRLRGHRPATGRLHDHAFAELNLRGG